MEPKSDFYWSWTNFYPSYLTMTCMQSKSKEEIWGRFKNTYELLNLRCKISNVPFEIPHKLYYPYIVKMRFFFLQSWNRKSF